jgi:hypothetical protein
VNGGPVAVGGNGDFGDVIQETFDVVEAPTITLTTAPTSADGILLQRTSGKTAGVVIELRMTGPEETGWTLRDSAGTLIVGPVNGNNFTTVGGTNKTAIRH